LDLSRRRTKAEIILKASDWLCLDALGSICQHLSMSPPAVHTNPIFPTRPVVDADWDAIAELNNCYQPHPSSGQILRQQQAVWTPGDPRLDIVATDSSGMIIGYCRSSRRTSEPEGIFRVKIMVHPTMAGQGLGRYLLTGAEKFATVSGGKYAMSSVEETCPRGIDFAKKAGYETVQHLFESTLDLVTFDPNPYVMAVACLEEEGFRFLNFSELGLTDENWQKLYLLDVATDKDTPGSEFWSLGTLQEYRTHREQMFGFLPDGIQVALFNDQWIGMNWVSQGTTPGQMVTEYTGVLKEFRGKGIAQGLKAQGIQFAMEYGAQTIRTNNDDRNAPMLAINRKLGFQEAPGFYIVRKELV